MWYAYVLESLKNSRFYYGSSGDLKRRFGEHNQKRGGRYSSKNAPFILVYYEAYREKADALKAEKFFKSGYGREVLKGKLSSYLAKRIKKP